VQSTFQISNPKSQGIFKFQILRKTLITIFQNGRKY